MAGVQPHCDGQTLYEEDSNLGGNDVHTKPVHRRSQQLCDGQRLCTQKSRGGPWRKGTIPGFADIKEAIFGRSHVVIEA